MEKEWPEWYCNNWHELQVSFVRMWKATRASHWSRLAEMVPKIAVERLSDTKVWVDLVTDFLDDDEYDPGELIKALAIIQSGSVSRDPQGGWKAL